MLKRLCHSVFILMVILGGMSLWTAAFNRSALTGGSAHAAMLGAAPLPETGVICYDFENGQLPAEFLVENSTNGPASGRVSVSSFSPHQGQYALNLDTACGGSCGTGTYTRQSATLPLNLTPGLETVLRFWILDHTDENHADDGVFIADGAGEEFSPLVGFNTLTNAYTMLDVDLDEAATAAGLTFDDQIRVKIQSYDNYEIPSDGYSIDNLCVCQEPQGVIEVDATRSGSNFILDWAGSEQNTYEVWTSINDPYFEPGEDCAEPGPYQCTTTTGPGFVTSSMASYPGTSHAFAVVARNACGQRTQGAKIGRAAIVSYSFTGPIATDLAVSLSTPQSVVFNEQNHLTQAVVYTTTYTNTSQTVAAPQVTLTHTLPASLRFEGGQSTAGWQTGPLTGTYTLSIGTIPPGGTGTAVFAAVLDKAFPATAWASVTIADGQLIDPKTANNAAVAKSLLVGTPDSDADNLPDWIETNTLTYAGPLSAGTNPQLADTDGDGIFDGDEVRGTQAGLDLPLLGAHPLRKTILIEFDWFETDLECGPHHFRPSAGTIQMLTAAFAAAPLSNPDGSQGIDLISDYGQGGAFTGGNLIPDADGVLSSGVYGTEFLAYKAAHFASNRLGYFHYAMLPHRYNVNSASSGQAELNGDDMIVSLNCSATDTNMAHTIMHELGHNLGLLHGGLEEINFKPNYNSVMNYRYQFSGVDTNCTPPGDGLLDYSSGLRQPLNENFLDEGSGICGGIPWDWNGNGQIESGVAFDLNGDGQRVDSLADSDDWTNLRFGTGTLDTSQFTPLSTERKPETAVISEGPLPEWATTQGTPER